MGYMVNYYYYCQAVVYSTIKRNTITHIVRSLFQKNEYCQAYKKSDIDD